MGTLAAVDPVRAERASSTAGDGDGAPIDGRVARRQRNIESVLRSVIDMFTEEMVLPTMEQAAQRSGLSLRTLYRYFPDPGELISAAIHYQQARNVGLATIAHIGQGTLEDRVADLVAARLRVHAELAPVFRAALHNAPHVAPVATRLAESRVELRAQVEHQFATELARIETERRAAVLDAADALTQLDTIEYLRRSRGLSVEATEAALVVGLITLLHVG